MKPCWFSQQAQSFVAGVVLVTLITGPLGCRNPAQSTLPPSAIPQNIETLPPMPKGEVYADETVVSPDTPIEGGDTLDVVIRRGAGEDKYTSMVRENGQLSVGFIDVSVAGLTVPQAETRIQEKIGQFVRDPRVQVNLKKKTMRVKRVFVFGDVKKPGMYPLSRNMTVIQAIAQAENYNETALLEEIRVIRGPLQQPQIYTADLARLYTYGDYSRNLPLEENDVVFVPREHLGDGVEASKKIMPIVYTMILPLYAVFVVPTFFPNVVSR
jgi:polysaccharide export outer membrane protein